MSSALPRESILPLRMRQLVKKLFGKYGKTRACVKYEVTFHTGYFCLYLI
jgi:hypothetical protein